MKKETENPKESQVSREKLFDLAINRSLSFNKKMGKFKVSTSTKSGFCVLEADLLSWHQQTRFAYRVSLEAIVRCLNAVPDIKHDYYWLGGPEGDWFEGKTSQP